MRRWRHQNTKQAPVKPPAPNATKNMKIGSMVFAQDKYTRHPSNVGSERDILMTARRTTREPRCNPASWLRSLVYVKSGQGQIPPAAPRAWAARRRSAPTTRRDTRPAHVPVPGAADPRDCATFPSPRASPGVLRWLRRFVGSFGFPIRKPAARVRSHGSLDFKRSDTCNDSGAPGETEHMGR